MMDRERIWLSPPHLTGKEMKYIKEAFRDNWIAPTGPHLDLFEQEFAACIGAENAVALNSGTAALHLALKVLDMPAGTDILVSDFTYVASVNPVLYEQCCPVFIDSSPETWSMDPQLLVKAIESRKKAGRPIGAVILVHVYGLPADVETIAEICDSHDIPLIEDTAESLGCRIAGKSAGTFGKCGIFSFNGNKMITTSGGGMLVTQDKALADHARYLSTQAKTPDAFHLHEEAGFNYRMSNILAGIGRGQLQSLDKRIRKKRQIFRWYKEELAATEGIEWMPEPDFGESVFWLSCFVINTEITGCENTHLIQVLDQHNIEARPLWRPMHMQPVLKDAPFFGQQTGRRLFERGICLPSGTSLKKAQVHRIGEIIRQTLSK